jgi:hypothetical protein
VSILVPVGSSVQTIIGFAKRNQRTKTLLRTLGSISGQPFDGNELMLRREMSVTHRHDPGVNRQTHLKMWPLLKICSIYRQLPYR